MVQLLTSFFSLSKVIGVPDERMGEEVCAWIKYVIPLMISGFSLQSLYSSRSYDRGTYQRAMRSLSFLAVL